MNVTWTKCQGDAWCPLNTVVLEHSHFDGLEGVFIIWHGGTSPATVLIGHGTIREQLKACRSDLQVQQYLPAGLFATWAAVPRDQWDGVVGFLNKQLTPKVQREVATAAEVPINVPW